LCTENERVLTYEVVEEKQRKLTEHLVCCRIERLFLYVNHTIDLRTPVGYRKLWLFVISYNLP